MKELLEYKTPRASVRGVFLCESVAAPAVSVLGAITQEEWGSDTLVKPTEEDSSGYYWIGF